MATSSPATAPASTSRDPRVVVVAKPAGGPLADRARLRPILARVRVRRAEIPAVRLHKQRALQTHRHAMLALDVSQINWRTTVAHLPTEHTLAAEALPNRAFLNQGGALRAPRAGTGVGLRPWGGPADARRALTLQADPDQPAHRHAAGAAWCRLPRRPIVQLAGTASNAPAAPLARSAPPTFDPAPTHKDPAPAGKTGTDQDPCTDTPTWPARQSCSGGCQRGRLGLTAPRGIAGGEQ